MRKYSEQTRMSKSFRNAGAALAWIGIALLPFAAAGCSHKVAAEDKVKMVEVGTTSPERKDVTRVVLQPGFLRPLENTPIYTKIAGFAKEPRFDIGDTVKKGELLVELDVPEVVRDLDVKKARIDQAKADLEQAKEASSAAKANQEAADAEIEAKKAAIRSADADVKRWLGEVERARELLQKGIYDKGTYDQDVNQWRSSEAKKDEAKANLSSAKANYDKASANYNKSRADIEVAKASVKVAKAAHAQWKAWLDYAQITAPFDGIITDRRVHTGHFLQPSNSGSTSKAAEPLFVMMRTDIMRCTVEVPELDSLMVRRGDKASVLFQAIPGVGFAGEVTRTTKALDEHTRTLRVEVWLKNATGATVSYTASANGVITSVEPVPLSGGAGYPPNATVPLQIIGGGKKCTTSAGPHDKQSEVDAAATSSGTGAIINATTDAAGSVIRCALVSGGSNYTPGAAVTGNTLFARELRPNMYANVSILPKLRDAWILPAEAVLNDILSNGDRRYCFVLEDDKDKKIARKVFLEIGSQCEEGWQILRKQRAGQTDWQEVTGKEIVVTTNNKALQDGQEVQLQAAPAH